MGGRFSRNKGRRVEYEIRDQIAALGYKVVRVPLSGASQGFKGDLEVTMHNNKIYGEVKARKDQFKSIYALLDGPCRQQATQIVGDGVSALISYSFDDLGFGHVVVSHNVINDVPSEYRSGKKKLLGTIKWVHECTFLVLKNDRCKPIFVRFIY